MDEIETKTEEIISEPKPKTFTEQQIEEMEMELKSKKESIAEFKEIAKRLEEKLEILKKTHYICAMCKNKVSVNYYNNYSSPAVPMPIPKDCICGRCKERIEEEEEKQRRITLATMLTNSTVQIAEVNTDSNDGLIDKIIFKKDGLKYIVEVINNGRWATPRMNITIK